MREIKTGRGFKGGKSFGKQGNSNGKNALAILPALVSECTDLAFVQFKGKGKGKGKGSGKGAFYGDPYGYDYELAAYKGFTGKGGYRPPRQATPDDIAWDAGTVVVS